MQKRHLFILFPALFLVVSCNSGNTSKGDTKTNKLVGTWRLVSFSDFDSATNKWVQPYGEHPSGYFTYTKSGVVI